MLRLPIHRAVRFLLVTPHYPENVGASCRAIKTMGFSEIGLVKPSRLASIDHPMAEKMAVKSNDVLESALIFDNLDEAVVGFDLVVATTSRRGVSGVVGPEAVAEKLVLLANAGKRGCIVFGNEKSGLTGDELGRADLYLRIPMAAPQPSINLAQAVQIVSYQLFRAALDQRPKEAAHADPEDEAP
jgi:TrmH family RNA methyltransferase